MELEAGPSKKAGGDHYASFVNCVRSRDHSKIAAPIEVWYRSHLRPLANFLCLATGRPMLPRSMSFYALDGRSATGLRNQGVYIVKGIP